MLIGPEEMTAAAVLFGVHGGVNGGANLFPRLYVSLYDVAVRGDMTESRRLHGHVTEISRRLYTPTYLQGVKCAAAALGLCGNILAPPGVPLGGDEAQSIGQAAAELSDVLKR